MDNVKSWYTSRAVWGGLIAMASSALMLTGHVIAPEMQSALLDLIMQVMSLSGGAVAIYGRIKANTAIGKAEPTNPALVAAQIGVQAVQVAIAASPEATEQK